MKLAAYGNKRFAFVLLLAPLVLAGCEQPASESNNPAQPAAQGEGNSGSVTMEDVQTQLNQAAETTKEYLSQQKEEYLTALKRQINALDQTIADLRQQGEVLTDDAKAQWQTMLAELQEKREAYQVRLDKLEESGDDAWREFQTSVEKAFTELKQATDAATNHLNEAVKDVSQAEEEETPNNMLIGDDMRSDDVRSDVERILQIRKELNPMKTRLFFWTLLFVGTIAWVGCQPTDYNQTTDIPTYDNEESLDGMTEDPDVQVEVGDGVDVQVDDDVEVQTDENGVDVLVDPSPEAEQGDVIE